MARRMRTCIACGQTDDGPKHVVAVDPVNDVNWHFDCHATVTGCEPCVETVKAAKGKKDLDLVEHLTGQRED